MNSILLYLILICFFSTTTAQLHGQSNSEEYADKIAFYADVTANAGLPEHRKRAGEELLRIFKEWINTDDFSPESLLNIDWLSVKHPEDKSFYLTTWQLKLSDNDHSYYGFLLRKDQEPIQLESFRGNALDLEYEERFADEWYGCLYYNLLEIELDQRPVYLLFGYDGYKDYHHRKVVDVLSFDETGQPIFGKEIFRKRLAGEPEQLKLRVYLEYSSDSNVSLNFNPALDMIVFDHLISRFGRIPGQGPTLLPDGSYVGYQFDGNYFNYIDKIYDQISEEAPRPAPILDGKNKDIFGGKQ